MSAVYSLGPYERVKPSAGNPSVSIEYELTINRFSGKDAYGRAFSGWGKMYFHYVFKRGVGRSASGWRLVADDGMIYFN